jgi:hypothetical protein
MNTKPLYESPQLKQNMKKYGYSDYQCICCGKPIKEGSKLYVHMNTDWLAVNPIIDEEKCRELTGADSQGCFPIGNDCAKKMIGFVYCPTIS